MGHLPRVSWRHGPRILAGTAAPLAQQDQLSAARLFACGGAALLAACGDSVRLTVLPAETHQVISGWEVTAQAGQEFSWYPALRDTLMTLAADLGITRLRLEVRSGSEQVRDYYLEGRRGALTGNAFRCARYETLNDDDDPRHINWNGFTFTELDHTVETVVMPLAQSLAARGERLSVTLTYVSFFRQCPRDRRYDHRDPNEYAEFVLATLLHLREKYHLVPDRWEMILEPDNTDGWTGPAIGRAMVATGARLREMGFDLRFVVPSTTSMAGALSAYDGLVSVPGAAELVGELAYHRYRAVSYDALRAIAARGARDHVATAMLEHIGSTVDDLLDDLTMGDVSAWQQYALAYQENRDDGGLLFRVEASDPARPVIREGRRNRLLRPVYRAVHPGAVRLGSDISRLSWRAAAFRNPDGGIVAVVRSGGAAQLLIGGLPAGRYSASFLGDESDSLALPDTAIGAGGTLALRVPGTGLLSVSSR